MLLLPPLQAVTKDSQPQDNQAAYWTQRYTIRAVRGDQGQAVEDVPSFLQACKEQVLTTGERGSRGQGLGHLGYK